MTLPSLFFLAAIFEVKDRALHETNSHACRDTNWITTGRYTSMFQARGPCMFLGGWGWHFLVKWQHVFLVWLANLFSIHASACQLVPRVFRCDWTTQVVRQNSKWAGFPPCETDPLWYSYRYYICIYIYSICLWYFAFLRSWWSLSPSQP